MEIRNYESNFQVLQEPEDFTFPGTQCVLSMIRVTPKAWARMQRQSTKIVPAKNRQPQRETKDEDKARELLYQHSIKGIKGLTRGIIEQRFLVSIPEWSNFPIDEEITFATRDVMLKHMIDIGSNSIPLNNFIWDAVVPTESEIDEDEKESERQKKIS